jgi:hypothetical protein
MDKSGTGKGRRRQRRGGGVGWFYLGALLGAVLAAGAVIVTSELHHEHGLRRLRRRRGMLDVNELPAEMDLVEGLTHVVSEGFSAMADAARQLGDSFGGARREQIRYGLESTGAAGHGASSHGWYVADDDDEPHGYHTAADQQDATAGTEPLPS